MRNLFILFLFFSFVDSFHSQVIDFAVLDSVNHFPVEHVQCIVNSNTYWSDENGYVRISRENTNWTTVELFAQGYISKKIQKDSLIENKQQLVYLAPKISSISEIKVYASTNQTIFKQLNQLDIQLRPITNSQDVLRMVPGLFIGQHAGGGKAEQIFLRGFDLDHGTDIQISVDGMPVNMVSHAHGQGYADLHFVIPEFIQQVNFNKGPYQADKGDFTTAGYVSFETKKYLPKNFVKLEGGEFGTCRMVTGLNLLSQKQREQNQSLIFGTELFFTKGYFDHPQDFSRINAFLTFHKIMNKSNAFSASISGFTSKWNASGQIPDRAVAAGLIGFYGSIDSKEGGQTSRYNATAEWVNQWKNGAKMTHQMFASNYAFELYSNFTFFKMDSINGDQIRQAEHRNLLGTNSTWSKEDMIATKQVLSSVGLQSRFDLVEHLELSHTKDRSITLQQLMLGNVQQMNVGIFANQKWQFNRKWSLEYGLRTDFFVHRYEDLLLAQDKQVHPFIVSPKLNLRYQMNDRVQWYLFNGKGFHSNDTRVAVQENGKNILPPAYGSDLGAFIKLNSKLVCQTALWFLWMGQEFIYVGDEGVVEAGGKSRRFGYDLSIRYECWKHVFFDLDLNLASPRSIGVPATEKYIPLAPVFTSIGGLTYKSTKNVSGSIRYRYMANRPANEQYSVTAQGYFILDATLRYTQPKWEVGMTIQNLLNTKWKETQFDTESKLQNESHPVSEIHFTPGSPFFLKLNFNVFFN